MAVVRPAGFSDEDSSDDDYGYSDHKPKPRNVHFNYKNTLRIYESKLTEAITKGDLDEFKFILKNDLDNDVNVKLDSGWTPLIHACFHGQETIVKYLLDFGAKPNLNVGVTAVMMACSNTSADETAIYNIVSMLIEKHCLLNIGDKYGLTPLMRSASSGRSTILKLILTKPVNIEMRDEKGWTALFWAVHHNQPECVKVLLSKGAEAKIFDKYDRTPAEIAESQDYTEIYDILRKHLQYDDENDHDEADDISDVNAWEDYYPDVKKPVPNYYNEVYHLLDGMNCKHLRKKFREKRIDLRTFLLLEEKDLVDIGVDMPYERQRILQGIRKFHTRPWTLNSVAGLYAGSTKNRYTMIEFLSVLGSHLQQLYILETSLAYVIREHQRLSDRLASEPPDSPQVKQFDDVLRKFTTHINSILREIKNSKVIVYKEIKYSHQESKNKVWYGEILDKCKNWVLIKQIMDDSLQPADLIKEKTTLEISKEYLTKLVLMCGMGFLAKVSIRKMFG